MARTLASYRQAASDRTAYTPAALYDFRYTRDVLPDLSSNGNTGICQGGVDNVAGTLSQNTKHCDGVDDIITLGTISNLDLNADLSLECWVKFGSLLSSSNDTFLCFVQQDQAVGDPDFQMGLEYNDDTKEFTFNWAVTGLPVELGSSALANYAVQAAIDTWYHVVGIKRQTANTMSVYVNGTKGNDYELEYVFQTRAALPWSLGKETTNEMFLDAYYGRVGFYPIAFTEAQVLALYNRDKRYYGL